MADASRFDLRRLSEEVRAAILQAARDGLAEVRSAATAGLARFRAVGPARERLAPQAIRTRRGFVVSTGTTIGGAAWEKGFSRRAFVVRPKKRALRIPVAAGFVFARRVTIPAGRFPARPWFRPAVTSALPRMSERATVLVSQAIAKNIPDLKRTRPVQFVAG